MVRDRGGRRRVLGVETPIFWPFLSRKLLFSRSSANAAESRGWGGILRKPITEKAPQVTGPT
jgi:hypothetical protein